MKKIFLSLTATILLCGALPQQTLAGCFGNSKQSSDIEMNLYGHYASVPTNDGETTQPSNACRQFLSNACDTTLKKAAWITGGIVGGGLVTSGYWWVPAVATAIAGGTTAIGTSNNATDGNAHLPKPEAFNPDAAAANNITQVANNVHSAIQNGNARWGEDEDSQTTDTPHIAQAIDASPKKPQKAKSKTPIQKPTTQKPKNDYNDGLLNTMQTSVQNNKFVSFAYLPEMTPRDAKNLFNRLNSNNLSGFYVVKKVRGKIQYLYPSSGAFSKAVWIDSAQHPLLEHLRENKGELPQEYVWS